MIPNWSLGLSGNQNQNIVLLFGIIINKHLTGISIHKIKTKFQFYSSELVNVTVRYLSGMECFKLKLIKWYGNKQHLYLFQCQ